MYQQSLLSLLIKTTYYGIPFNLKNDFPEEMVMEKIGVKISCITRNLK